MSPLQLLALPAHAGLLLSWELTSDQDLRRVRTDLHRLLAPNQDQDQDQDQAEHDEVVRSIGLVATELAGNALRHGLPPIVVRLLGTDDCYIIDVSDHDPQHGPELGGTPQQTRAGGRGLHIARSLAWQLSWFRTRDVKHVWASFRVPPAPPVT
ncbi:ATP-binding protein [Actinoplanes derwentensis]|nr:ATP-binding protein [Actinoplanes derwentensis]